MDRVPLIVKVCTSIVEERGLEIVGIYRVPGNNAAVTHLTELVNKPVDEWSKLEDGRWNDVNVVSSLLKSFFRKLPEPLFTFDLYQVFVEASKIEDTNIRLCALKRLARQHLPEPHFDTLHVLANHLCRVAEKSETNKMEVKNLAIVFGPTLVRTTDDNMLSMVTDMSHQCRIVESILSNKDWFFDSDESHDEAMTGDVDMDAVMNGLTGVGSLNGVAAQSSDALNEISNTVGSQSVLLSNLQKLEEAGKVGGSSKDVSAKDIVSGIISAANRKMLRAATAGGKSAKKESIESQTDGGKRVSEDQTSKSNHGSRRNSESVLQSAMAIAAAVPQLVVANTKDAKRSEKRSEAKCGPAPCPSFPIETYQGLDEATAERIKRFEDETKAMLMRSTRTEHSEICRTTSGKLRMPVDSRNNSPIYFFPLFFLSKKRTHTTHKEFCV